MTVTAQDVASAALAIKSYVVRTPTIAATRLSEMLGLQLFLKLENLQFTGSFKDRGSCLKLQRLAPANDPPAGGNSAPPPPASPRRRPQTIPRACPTTRGGSAWEP